MTFKRPDLLGPQAAIDWAVSNFPSFEQKLDNWMHDNLYSGIEKTTPDIDNDILAIFRREHFPLRFNVEFGVYINAIRSSLDMLAFCLFERFCRDKVREDQVYFPIASNAISLQTAKGNQFVKSLPDAERDIIESLKPYKGGNDLLWLLHQLDIRRKHFRSLNVEIVPTSFSIRGVGTMASITPLSTGFSDACDKSIIGLIKKGSPEPDIKFTPQITVNEPDLFPSHMPAVGVLHQFATHASSIIKLFDR